MSQIDDFLDGKTAATSQSKSQIDEFLDGAKPPERSAFAVANDTAIEFGSAVAGGVSSAANFVKPGNAVSGWIDENIIKAGEAKQSDLVKAEKAKFRDELEQADGIGGELAAVGRYVVNNPLQVAAQAAGSFVGPGVAVKGAGALARGVGAGAKSVERAGLAGGAAAGAAMAGGDAAGTAHELASKAGATEEQATAAGRSASVIPAVVGGLGGVFGAERLLAGGKGFAGGAAARAGKTALAEGAQEAVEEGVTQYEGQRAAVPFDPTLDPSKGVAAAAGMGAIMGGATGAGVSLLTGRHGDAQGAGTPAEAGAAAFTAGQPAQPPAELRSVADKAAWARGWRAAEASAAAQARAAGELSLAPQDQPAPVAAADELAAEPAGTVQRTFDPRDPNSRPPLDLMPPAPTDGLPFDAGQQQVDQRDFDTGGLSLADPAADTAPAQRPSEAMGLDANAGSLSAAAVRAVDTGASQQVQREAADAALAEAAEKADKQAPKKPANTSRAPEVDKDTGEMLGGQMATWTDEQLSGAFRAAQGRDVRVRLAKEMQRRREAREQQNNQPNPQQTNEPKTDQAQQAASQRPQEAAAPAGALDDTAPASGGARPAAALGQRTGAVADAAPAQNTGAQAGAALGPQAAAQGEGPRQRAKRIDEAGAAWTRMTGPERQALAERTDVKPVIKKNLARANWANLNSDVKRKLADALQPAAPAEQMQAFAPETGTLGVPRSEMPQVPTQSHGGLVKHLNAQGIQHKTTTVDAAALKPTQAEYSPERVEAAKTATGDRAIIVSNDGHIIDGHHQAMAAAEEGRPVKAIVLGAPVEQALEAVRNSPSAAAPAAPAPGSDSIPDPIQDADSIRATPSPESRSEAIPEKISPAAEPAKQPAAKKATPLQRAKAKRQAITEHYTPGNIVRSFGGGHDRVLAFTPAGPDGRWSVQVQPVERDGDAWRDVPGSKPRTHGTEPSARELTEGPVEMVKPNPAEAVASKTSADVPASQEAVRRLDHGELNIPGRTSTIDAELDRYKATQAKDRKEAARERSVAFKKRKADARAALAEHGEQMVQSFTSLEPAAAMKELQSMATWEPERLLALVDRWKGEQAVKGDVVPAKKTVRGVAAKAQAAKAKRKAKPDPDPKSPPEDAELDDVPFRRLDGTEGMTSAVANAMRMLSQPTYTPQARAQAVASVQKTVDAIRQAWGNSPDVVVAFDMGDPVVPFAARRADLKQRSGGARGAPEGFYYRGKAYLMASRLGTPDDAARVLFHEVLGHHGLRGRFGKNLDAVLNQVATMRRADVDAKVKEYGLRGVNRLDRRAAAEEVLAEMAQKTPQLHFVQRAISAIRNWLRAHVPGLSRLALTDADIIQAYILPARGWVERGGPEGGPDGGLRFSRSSDESGTDAFRSWFADSKVVNADGTPMVVYHGTASPNITEFLPQAKGGSNTDRSHELADWFRKAQSQNARIGYMDFRSGSFFSPDPAYAGNYTGEEGGVVYPVYISAKNPIYMDQRTGKVTGTDPTKTPDALIMRDGEKINEIAVLDPRQIKSATGNNGEFDPGNADIRFSRAKLADLKDSALKQIDQTLSHAGTVSLWDKTVGTMRHLAQRAPAFKPVFEAAQRFVDDVSMLANDSANYAPRLLPRVEDMGDIVGKNRKKPISAEDNKAVARPLFEGTLMWARDVDGKPILADDMERKYAHLPTLEKTNMLMRAGKIEPGVLKMWQGRPIEQYEKLIDSRFKDQILRTGVVWSDAELASIFKSTPQQISLYREARATVDRSLDMTTRADIMRALGKEYAGLRDAVLDLPTLDAAVTFLSQTLQEEARAKPDAADHIADLQQLVNTRVDKAKELMAEGYAPLSRFGQYTVDVVDAAGERQYFGMFETKAEANQMRLRMQDAFPGATVTSGTMSREAFKLFAGITPESLEMFGNMLGLEGDGDQARDRAFQEYLKLAKNNHSALKRLIHRKGIAGYSEDVGRVLASFVYSNARQAAGGLNVGGMDQAINDIPKQEGELKDLAMGLRDYIKDPQEEGQAIRGMLFAQYLGGSLASAFVNMTQPFQVTLPWMSQYGGMRKASAQLARALKDMGTRGMRYEADLATALKAAEDDGVVSPQEIHQLMAMARGTGALRAGDGTRMGDARATAANAWTRTKVAWGQPFALAEQFNRRSTFIAAFRLAKEQGMQHPSQFARDAVLETQFLYSKSNKPRWARGAVGGTLFTFKTYSVSYLELMQRMWTQGGPEGKRAVGWSMAMLLLMGGAGGLPFVEDLEDLIDGAGQLMGYNLSSKQWRKDAMRDVLGKEVSDFIEQGVSGLPGAPVDVSGRLGMGNLIPGTGLFLSKQSRERDLLEVVGPAGDLVARGFGGARKVLTGDVGGAALEISPSAVRNAAKGIDMAASGIYKDTKGYKVIDTTLAEAASKFIGFQPKAVAEVQEANSFMLRSKSFYTQTSAEIKAQWADALFRQDESALERVRDRLAAWNRDNPEQPIVVKMPDIWKRVREMGKDRNDRIADTAPKALRGQMREMAADAAR